MNPEENEKLGLALNLIEALNMLALTKAPKRKSYFGRIWIHLKIQEVINLMDQVLA